MKAVLGLSMTAHGVGWVLVDGDSPEGSLDDDAFDVDNTAELVGHCVAAVRGARAIAASSGHDMRSVGIVWSEDIAVEAGQAIAALTAAGCDDVRAVPPDDEDECPDTDLSAAHLAARAVATNVVTRRQEQQAPSSYGGRGRAVRRIAGAVTAAFVVAVVAVGSQLAIKDPGPAAEQRSHPVVGTPQIVSASLPQVRTPRTAVVQPTPVRSDRAERIMSDFSPVQSEIPQPTANVTVQATAAPLPGPPPTTTTAAAPIPVAHLPATSSPLPGPVAPGPVSVPDAPVDTLNSYLAGLP